MIELRAAVLLLLLGALPATAIPQEGAEAPDPETTPATAAASPQQGQEAGGKETAPELSVEDKGKLRIRWQPWGRSTFETAARLKRPVLLYLRTADCRLCQLMERDIFDDDELVADLARDVVPIAVDADLRPDLANRYLIGAIPTVAYLLPNGEPMYRIEDPRSLERVGAYMTDAERFGRYMVVAVRYMKRHGREMLGKAREVAALEASVRDYPPGGPPFDRLDDLEAQIRDRADFARGGFGRGWKTIDDAPYRLFRGLAAGKPSDALAKFTVTTGRSILGGAIHDGVEGGFHHYSTARDWSTPSREKRLDANARALRLLVAAHLLQPDDQELRAGVASTAAFILERLTREDGGFALAQQGGLGPDDAGTYFESDAEGRQGLKPPPIEPTLIGSYNADAVVALLEGAAVLADTKVEDAALRALDVLSRRLYRAGRGMSRTIGPDGEPLIQGLLVDQVRAMEAFLLAFERWGRPEDLQKSVEIARFCRDNLRREPGYHVDRPDDAAAVGKMKRPIVDFAENGRLALALLKLSSLANDEEWRRMAESTVGALATGISKVTERDAAYLEALLALRSPAIHVVVPGSPTDPAVLAMRRRATLLPQPGVVVLTQMPPGLDANGAEAGSAWMCSGDRCTGPLGDPGDLAGGVQTFLAGND